MSADDGAHQQWALPNVEVYHTERWGGDEGFRYRLPIPQDGLYTLILKFSEVYFQEPEQKIFDVKIGSRKVVENLDIFGKLYSRGIPYDEFIEVTVKNGKAYIDVRHFIFELLAFRGLRPRRVSRMGSLLWISLKARPTTPR